MTGHVWEDSSPVLEAQNELYWTSELATILGLKQIGGFLSYN